MGSITEQFTIVYNIVLLLVLERDVFEGSEKTKREPQGERVSVMLPNIDSATAFCVYLMDPVVIWPL